METEGKTITDFLQQTREQEVSRELRAALTRIKAEDYRLAFDHVQQAQAGLLVLACRQSRG